MRPEDLRIGMVVRARSTHGVWEHIVTIQEIREGMGVLGNFEVVDGIAVVPFNFPGLPGMYYFHELYPLCDPNDILKEMLK